MPNTTYGTPFVASSDLVSAYPGVSSTLATRVDDISLKGNGLNDQTGTTYTLVLTDGGKTVTLNNASAVTVTIPTNTSVAFPLGTEINFVNKGAGTVTIQPTGGVTLNGGNLTLPQNAAVQVVKLETNTWGQLDSVASTPGLTLISPTSIANSGGSASNTAGFVSVSSVTSISLNGVFSASYDVYRMNVRMISGSGSPTLTMRMRLSGTDNTSASYQRHGYVGGTAASNVNTSGATSWDMVGLSTGTHSSFSYDIFWPAVAAQTSMIGANYDASGYWAGISANHSVATAYDGFTLYVGSGNFTGQIRVFGYRN